MKLELKHLSPYLPYSLRVNDRNTTFELNGSFLDEWFNYGSLPEIKPILKPMSDLQTEYWQSAAKEEARNNQDEYSINHKTHVNNISVGFYFWLIEHHFDVFGLITAGLAIDINTL